RIRSMQGVRHVIEETWFGGQYKNDKPENYFAQFATDPQEVFEVFTDFKIPPDQLEAWKKDRAGCVADADLAKQHGWKIGDRLNLKGTIFPLNPELTIRGMFTASAKTESIYFNSTYLDEGAHLHNFVGFFVVLADSPQAVPEVAKGIDSVFRN